MSDALSTADVARICNVPHWKIRRLFEVNALPEPTRLAGRRIVPRDMLPQIIDALAERRWLTGPVNTHLEAACV